MVDAVLDGHAPMSDFYVYPLVALYRHHVELQLKHIIILAQKLLGKVPRRELGHDLMKFWETARPLIEQALPDEPRQEHDLVQEYLKTIERMPYDFGRYPVDIEGRWVKVPHEFETINLKTLKQAIGRLPYFLGGVSNYMDELESHRDWQ